MAEQKKRARIARTAPNKKGERYLLYWREGESRERKWMELHPAKGDYYKTPEELERAVGWLVERLEGEGYTVTVVDDVREYHIIPE